MGCRHRLRSVGNELGHQGTNVVAINADVVTLHAVLLHTVHNLPESCRVRWGAARVNGPRRRTRSCNAARMRFIADWISS